MKYFDCNATTSLKPVARDAWVDANAHAWQNPSTSYDSGVRVKALIKVARVRLGEIFEVDPDLLVFCSGATEACNMWINSFFADASAPNQVLLAAAQEHSCMSKSIVACAEDRVIWFSPHHENVIHCITEQLDMHPAIGGVVMMAANNETGICFPWLKVAGICRSRGIPFFCDASQWIGKLPLDGFETLDYFCGSAHKFGGPKGTGFLKVSRRFSTVNGLKGGGQEGGARSGTEDYASIVAMVKALDETLTDLEKVESVSIREKWRLQFIQKLQEKIPAVRIHNKSCQSLWNTVSVALPLKPASYWVEALERRGFEVSAGAACSSSKKSMSHVLKDMDVSDTQAKQTVRISSGWGSLEKDWTELLEAIFSIHADISGKSNDGLAEVVSIDEL